ncbi:hypothetical protein RVIR1_06820 [Candidatus Rickettsiella viridis]|uniref:Uncharacterized protein n=1 Tax=Candidatus Rickettsiella viridis TaxID=676208 RepID=A0A2Z5UUF4_9COXI|nr:hypothetical protein RVIR1_06820 [Candidatus Rickettsiella viridis]
MQWPYPSAITETLYRNVKRLSLNKNRVLNDVKKITIFLVLFFLNYRSWQSRYVFSVFSNKSKKITIKFS